MDSKALRRVLRSILAIGMLHVAAPSAFAPLRPEPGAIDLAPRALVDRLRADPYVYFRFVNRPWTARVCNVLAGDLRDLPHVRLHGDAHIEQFAVTTDAWGLDDFDDSTRGSAVVDVVRFLGSIDLVLRLREWTRNRHMVFGRFFEGYLRGLSSPEDRPPQPSIVGRLRAEPQLSRASFLAWGDSQMEPMTDESMAAVVTGTEAVARAIHAEHPDLPVGYMAVVRAGWLNIGIGSALTPKILIRVQGPTTDPDDDELVEAKQLRDLSGLRCVESPPPGQPTLRVIVGTRQIGRLKPHILAAGPELNVPELVVRNPQLRDWWIRSWDPSYRELRVDDLRSVADLAAIAYDAGEQLGAGSLSEETGSRGVSVRARERAAFARLEHRIGEATLRLVDELLLGWKELMAR